MQDQQQQIERLEARITDLEARVADQDQAARRARWFRIAIYAGIGLVYVLYLVGLSGLS